MSENLLELPDQELKEKIWSEFGLNKERINEAVEKLKDWLKQQPHLPNDLDDVRLQRFLLNCENSMENTKMALDLYYTLKSICPEFMTGWDTQEDWFEKISSVGYMYPLRELTSEGDRILMIGFTTTDAKHFEFINMSKIALMLLEIRTSEDYWRSNIMVIDLRHITLAHVPKFTLPNLRMFEIIFLQGYNCRVEAIHLLNVPPLAEFVINMFKSVLKAKIAKLIQVHGSDLTGFYKQVPKHLLPSDFGGNGGKIAEGNASWKKKLQNSRDWLLERENLKSDEKRRPGKVVNSGDIFGFEGSFRKLNVD